MKARCCICDCRLTQEEILDCIESDSGKMICNECFELEEAEKRLPYEPDDFTDADPGL